MSGKNHLTLYVDSDLISLAKATKLNLSQEFEQWIRIRVNKMDDNKPTVDAELEIAKYRAAIAELQSQQELDKQKKDKAEEENMVLDDMIANMKKFNESLTEISDARIHGIQFLFQKKYNRMLNTSEANNLLLNRIKETANA